MAKEKQSVINLRERVRVKATEKNPYLRAGEELDAHPIVAKKGVEIGHYEIVKKS